MERQAGNAGGVTDGAAYRNWPLLEKKLSSANRTEIVNHFRKSWKGNDVLPCHVNLLTIAFSVNYKKHE